MTFLDCSVTGCAYNADKCCCKGEIKVQGSDAKHSGATCCGSFRERTGDTAVNAAKRISKSTDVVCEACNCRFNGDQKCSAQHIGIAGGEACDCAQTECASFYCCK